MSVSKKTGNKYLVQTHGFILFLFSVEAANQLVMVYIGQQFKVSKN
jgi:hypothetical protein